MHDESQTTDRLIRATRRAALEEVCALLCRSCKAGRPIEVHQDRPPDDNIVHKGKGRDGETLYYSCYAIPVRALMEKP